MLTQKEMAILRDHHKWWAKHYRDCEQTNVGLSRDPEATSFTPTEWMERAQAFSVERKHHQSRQKFFSKLLKAK